MTRTQYYHRHHLERRKRRLRRQCWEIRAGAKRIEDCPPCITEGMPSNFLSIVVVPREKLLEER